MERVLAHLAVPLEVLANSDSLLDQVVEVLRDLGSEALRLEDTEDLVAGDKLDLGNTVRVTENDTDLRWGETTTGELEDLVGDFLWGGL